MKGKKLYRDAKNAKLGGICAGLAEYYGCEAWIIRLLVISAFIFSAGFFVVLAYIIIYFILNEMPVQREWQQSIYSKQHVKQKPWQAGHSVEQILENVSAELDKADKDIEQLEAYVTSFSYKMDREFASQQ